MNRDQAIARIREIEPAIRAMGVKSLYLFGSTVRNEASSTSDVDIFFDRDPEQPLGLMGLAKLEAQLETILGASVDVTTRGSLHPLLRPSIEQQAVQVF